jgi:hypothetical protein
VSILALHMEDASFHSLSSLKAALSGVVFAAPFAIFGALAILPPYDVVAGGSIAHVNWRLVLSFATPLVVGAAAARVLLLRQDRDQIDWVFRINFTIALVCFVTPIVWITMAALFHLNASAERANGLLLLLSAVFAVPAALACTVTWGLVSEILVDLVVDASVRVWKRG